MFESLIAWSGIIIPLMILIALLYAIISLLRNEFALPAFILGIFLLLSIPIWLDRIIIHKWYLVLPFESSRGPEEWMDFLGSYLGVAGTIVVGALAYWQTIVNRKQDEDIRKSQEEIEELRDELTSYQMRPIIVFTSGILEAYYKGRQEETNRNMYCQKYYSICGLESSNGHSSFIYIAIPFQEKGLIPLKKVVIDKIEWKIDGRLFHIELEKTKYTMTGEQILILIDEDDDITESSGSENAGLDLLKFMMMHQGFFQIGKSNFDQSIIHFNILFENQLGLPRRYQLSYFMFPEAGKNSLTLTDPHIIIVDTDETEVGENKDEGLQQTEK